MRQQKAPRKGFLHLNITIGIFFCIGGVLHHAGLALERPRVAFVNGMCSRRIVSCCSDLDLINAVKLSAGRQQLSRSLAWDRLFSQEPRLTFSANRAGIDVGLRNVRFGS
jgi:hypothetical protein